MKKETRETIESSAELQALLNSEAWAKDTIGSLYGEAVRIVESLGFDRAIADEWLREED